MERALDLIGDRWTFLLLREAFFGVDRFESFLQHTGISTAVLTQRLTQLVEHDLFAKIPDPTHSRRFSYRLTERGQDLYPVIAGLLAWGDRWLAGEDGPPLELVHACGATSSTRRCDGCDEPITARTTTWRPGPGAG